MQRSAAIAWENSCAVSGTNSDLIDAWCTHAAEVLPGTRGTLGLLSRLITGLGIPTEYTTRTELQLSVSAGECKCRRVV